jgi:hypothetical protein
MLFGLLRREKETAAPGGYRPARRARPGLEALEGRLVPAAVRNLSGFLANTLPANDDDTTDAVNLGFNINFFGDHTGQVYVSNNGIITLNQADSTNTPLNLKTAQAEPVIAPFWADVDTRGDGGLVTFGTDTIAGHAAFGVDYHNVNYFDATAPGHLDRFNDFQVILINRSDTGAGNFDIEFNYNTITWETGDLSGTGGQGGQSAIAGYSGGNGSAGTFFQLPGSGTNGAFLDGGANALAGHSLSANTPGRYHFAVRNGRVAMVNVSAGAEITGLVSTVSPLQMIYNAPDHTYRGNLAVVANRLGGQTSADAALDETSAVASALTGRFRITVVYENLPSGVTLANATGHTASGAPYVSTSGPVTFGPGLTVRIPVRFTNPGRVPLSLITRGPTIRVFAGPFNPADV